jgi:hypothetical protein
MQREYSIPVKVWDNISTKTQDTENNEAWHVSKNNIGMKSNEKKKQYHRMKHNNGVMK